MKIHALAFALQIGFLLVCSAAAQRAEWTKPLLPSIPAARSNASMAYDPVTNSTVLFGGNINNGFTAFGDTWVFSRALGWGQLFPAVSPSPRSGSGFAYDSLTATAVLFGGTAGDGTYLDDTWTWNGAGWTQQFPPVSPPARGLDTEQMAFDEATGTVVLFGGGDPHGGFFGDTWVWDGRNKTWTQQFPASSPSPRGTTLAYDKAAKQVIVFGGGNGGETFFDDTWTWNGITWTERFPTFAPSARANHAMQYDASIGKVVLFGGYSNVGGEALNDTWTWNGTGWSEVQTPVLPKRRYGSWMAYDPRFEGLVLFGGYFTGGPYSN